MSSASFDTTAGDLAIPPVPGRLALRRRAFTATFLAAAILALGGAG